MSNVTSSNFLDIKQEIIDNIQNCEFMAMDLEFSGINQQTNCDDLPFEVYGNLKEVAQQYCIFQLGLCTFTSDMNGGYMAHPYNVYLFPKTNNIWNPDIKGKVNTLHFNSQHGMDYNMWIKQGVSYVQQSKKEELENFIFNKSQEVEEKKAQKMLEKMTKINSDKVKAEQGELKIWYDDKSRQEKYPIDKLNKAQKEYIIQYQKEEMPMIKFQIVQDKYFKNQIIFEKITQKDLDLQFEEIYGFTAIMDKIYEGNKPIITHNGLQDHLYMYNTFKSPLPDSYEVFKQQLEQKFPPTYDTKLISSLFQDKFNTKLEYIKEYMLENQDKFKQRKPITLPESYEQDKYHEAGYDAYLTGWVYVQLLDTYSQEICDYFQNKFDIMYNDYQINFKGQDIRYNDSLKYYIYNKENLTPNNDQQEDFIKYLQNEIKSFKNYVKITYRKEGLYVLVLNEDKKKEYKKDLEDAMEKLKTDKYQIQKHEDYVEEKENLLREIS